MSIKWDLWRYLTYILHLDFWYAINARCQFLAVKLLSTQRVTVKLVGTLIKLRR